jgi:hypothetical protein
MHRRKIGFVEGQRKAASSRFNMGLVGSRQARKSPAATFQPRTVQPFPTVAPQVKKPTQGAASLPSLRKHITANPPAHFFYAPQIEF